MLVDVSLMTQCSGYFEALVRSGMREARETTVCLELIDSDTLDLIVLLCRWKDTALYVQKLQEKIGQLHLEIIENILNAGDYLNMPCLKICCCALVNTMLEAHWFQTGLFHEIWDLCQSYGLGATEEFICRKLAISFSRVIKEEQVFFHELPLEVLVGILARPDIDLRSEVDVMKCIYEWINYSQETRIKHFDQLFKCVSIPSLSHTDVCKIHSLLQKLHISHVDIKQLSKRYTVNPIQYFSDSRGNIEMRDSQDVLILFGGAKKHLLFHGEQSFKKRPAIHKNIEDVCYFHLNRHSDVNSEQTTEHAMYCRTVKKLMLPSFLTEFGICLHEGYVYIAGGQRKPSQTAEFAAATVIRMDPYSGSCSQICAMKEKRCLFNLCAVWDRIYAVGGACQNTILKTTEYYVPKDDKWYEGLQLPTVLHEHAGCVFQDKLYISGGASDTQIMNKVWVLASRESDWTEVASMLQPRTYHAMAGVHDKLYVVGGCVFEVDKIRDVYTVEQYNFSTDAWTNIFTLNVPVCCCLPVTIDDQLFFVGGFSFDQATSLHQAVAVDVKQQKWKVSPLKTNTQKKVTGYSCLRMKISGRLLK